MITLLARGAFPVVLPVNSPLSTVERGGGSRNGGFQTAVAWLGLSQRSARLGVRDPAGGPPWGGAEAGQAGEATDRRFRAIIWGSVLHRFILCFRFFSIVACKGGSKGGGGGVRERGVGLEEDTILLVC